MLCPGGGIGRHKGFKIPRRSRCAGSSPARGTIKDNATLAQLVERNLAKVEVTSSNLVCRSKSQFIYLLFNNSISSSYNFLLSFVGF